MEMGIEEALQSSRRPLSLGMSPLGVKANWPVGDATFTSAGRVGAGQLGIMGPSVHPTTAHPGASVHRKT